MNNKITSLIKNTLIVALGKICTQFVSFILLPFYTTYLSTTEFGVVDLLNTYISLLIPLVFLQMDQAVFRFLIDVRGNEKKEKEIITTSSIFSVVESVIYIIIYLIVAQFINNDYKIFLGFNVVISMFANLILQINRGIGDNAGYSFGCMVSGLGTIVLNVIMIRIFNMGAYGVLTASLLANLICIVVLLIKKRMFRYIKLSQFNNKYLKQMLKYSIPLVPNMLSWWIINVSDRTIISIAIDVGANGIYSAANKFSTICVSLFNIFSMTWSESASLCINDKDKDEFFNKIINNSITLFSCICIEGIAIMPFVFNIFIHGENFAPAYNQIAILLVATIFNIIVSLFGSIYVALKKTKEIAKTSIYAAVINIFVNLILIKSIGIYAASLSTLIAYFLMSLYRYYDVKKYIKISLEYKTVIIIVMVLIINIISYYSYNRLMYICDFLFTTIFSIGINKKFILASFKEVKKRIKDRQSENVL